MDNVEFFEAGQEDYEEEQAFMDEARAEIFLENMLQDEADRERFEEEAYLDPYMVDGY